MDNKKIHIHNGAKFPPPILKTEEERRLWENMNRSDMEKFRLFTQMLRNNALLKKAKITHK